MCLTSEPTGRRVPGVSFFVIPEQTTKSVMQILRHLLLSTKKRRMWWFAMKIAARCRSALHSYLSISFRHCSFRPLQAETTEQTDAQISTQRQNDAIMCLSKNALWEAFVYSLLSVFCKSYHEFYFLILLFVTYSILLLIVILPLLINIINNKTAKMTYLQFPLAISRCKLQIEALQNFMAINTKIY